MKTLITLGVLGLVALICWADVKHQERIVEQALLEHDILTDPARDAGDGYSVLEQRTA